MGLKKIVYTKGYQTLLMGIWRDNPIFSQVLGICSSLAVTNKVGNAIAMGAGVTFVLICQAILIAPLRKIIPARVRMIVYMIIIAIFVIIVDRYFKAYFPDISTALGPYVGLIITNCILMGRAEAFQAKNNTYHSILDALANGLGYSFSLLVVSVIREILAFGTILETRVMPDNWTNWVVMAMAPGAFFLFSMYDWIMRTLAKIKP